MEPEDLHHCPCCKVRYMHSRAMVRRLVKLTGADGRYLVAASQRQGNLEIFELNGKQRTVDVDPGRSVCILKLINGKIKSRNLTTALLFYRSLPDFISLGDSVSSVQISNKRGQLRNMALDKRKKNQASPL